MSGYTIYHVAKMKKQLLERKKKEVKGLSFFSSKVGFQI